MATQPNRAAAEQRRPTDFRSSGGIRAHLFKRPEASHLIVLLHGWTHAPSSFSQVFPDIEAALPGADLLIPKLPLAWASLADLDLLAERLVSLIAECTSSSGGDELAYQRITLAGHSCGGILARQLYLAAIGVRLAPGRVDVPSQPAVAWVSAVDRIVLLAAVNRGWTITSAMSPWLRFVSPLLIGLGHLLDFVPGRSPVVFQIRRGSAHLTNLRLKWMALERARREQLPPVIQLVGTIDDIVAPEDNIDLVTGGRFIYLEVAHSGHFNVINTDDPVHGALRAELICAALSEPVSELEKRSERRQIRAQSLPSELSANVMSNGPTVERQHEGASVCFIVHGIRDNGHWTRKIGERVLDRADQLGKRCFIYTPTYGFFPLLAFALPWTRREKVEWFLDLYVDALSRHPDAEMVFVGHSNGTYLLAKGLSLCPSMRFDRVLFAGSVVRRNYDWPGRVAQARKVINLVATADWVVALFPRAFEIVPLQDLGSAGHDGFERLPLEANLSYVPGDHGAGIREEMWDDIAAFAIRGDQPMRESRTVNGRLALDCHKSWLVSLLGELSPLSWLLLIGGIIGGACWMLLVLPAGGAGLSVCKSLSCSRCMLRS